jgi:hypothetical protein
MKIQWNKVTWYSKFIALVLFVILPFIGFWFGIKYGLTIAPLSDASAITSAPASSTTAVFPGSEYYSHVAEWQTYQDTTAGFSIAYPIDFTNTANSLPLASTNWRLNAGQDESGYQDFSLTIPSAFEPQTNFQDSTLTVGRSANAAAVANCFASDPSGSPSTPSSTMIINGISFVVFHSNDAGAGNLYDTTSYRTVHAGECYAIEYTIHSSQIANYPASYDLQPFNEKQVSDVFDRVVGTFHFL